jgi:hypothetical protein
LEKLKAEEEKLAELERIAKEEEEVELARQANELGELARQQELELQNNAEEAAPVEDASEPVVEAPESPAVEEETPAEAVVEESIVEPESAAVEEEPVAEE